jgi:hypothetical protein
VTTLGEKYRDKATGWEGIATAHVEYLDDAPSVRLQRVGQSGELEEQYFAEGRLELAEPEKGAGFR